MNNSGNPAGIPLSSLIVGMIIFIATLVAWLYAADNHIDPGPLWVLTGPVIASLFLSNSLSRVASNAQTAAVNTNGGMDARIAQATTQAVTTALDGIDARIANATSTALAQHNTAALTAIQTGQPLIPVMPAPVPETEVSVPK